MPNVLFLMQMKRSVTELKNITDDLPYQGVFVVPSVGRRGALAMIWKEEVDLHIQTYTQNHIDAIIYSNTGLAWRITGFYGQLNVSQR